MLPRCNQFIELKLSWLFTLIHIIHDVWSIPWLHCYWSIVRPQLLVINAVGRKMSPVFAQITPWLGENNNCLTNWNIFRSCVVVELLMPFFIEIPRLAPIIILLMMTTLRGFRAEMFMPHLFKTVLSHHRENFVSNSLAVTCSFSNHREHLLVKIFRR